MIYPYLSYGNITWGNTFSTRVQKKTNWSSLQRTIDCTSRWYKAIGLFMFNNLPSSFDDSFPLNKDIPQYNTRSSSNLHKFQPRIKYQKHSVKYKGVSIWNNLTKSIEEIKTFILFRKQLKVIFSHTRELSTWMISFSLFFNYYNNLRNTALSITKIIKIIKNKIFLQGLSSPQRVC